MGFIEPVFDYEKRVEEIEADKRSAVTSVMIGNVQSSTSVLEDEEWYPSDLVSLLGLATGRRVSAPWVELRDGDGKIVARRHHRVGDPSLSKGTGIIDEGIDASTGLLLTSYLKSQYRGSVFLRVAIGHLLRSLSGSMTIDDRLGHLFRAAEGLAVGLDLCRSRPLEMTPSTRSTVEASISQCIAELERIARSSADKDKERVMQIRSRFSDVAANRPSFKTQLLDLIDQAGLSDAKWLRCFEYRAYRTSKRIKWTKAANEYRNSIFHSAYIDFNDTYDIDNAIAFMRHLSDVLIRVVLHLIEFDGYYKAICGWQGMVLDHQRLDWAVPEKLSGESLGYSE
jgi:hypothetical protein